MPCYHPIPAWWSKKLNDNGKRGVVFSSDAAYKDRRIEVPCGKCDGCLLERSRQWAVRCLHESKLWDSSVFVTLTYEDNPVSLRPRDYVLFMKRLRMAHGGVRFFQCGEYGDVTERPHHHALLFNCAFADKRFLKKTDISELYTSDELDKLWSHGQCTFGAVTFESAAYCARYTLKKVGFKDDKRVAPYVTMSRRPGIGAGFVQRFRKDVYPSDQVVVRGVACRPPRFYDMALAQVAPSVLEKVKRERRIRQFGQIRELGGELENGKKLLVREIVTRAAISTLKREV